MSIDSIRRDYDRGSLDRDELPEHPHQQFQLWFEAAVAAPELSDPTAMTLATIAENGMPTQRIVLLKHTEAERYCFYTNYQSRKGRALSVNPNCSLHFAWLSMERQILIEGTAVKLTSAENDRYFHSRPRASQLGAWASAQSEEIADRAALDAQFKAMEARFADQTLIPRPEHWGGYAVQPVRYEFWQGGRARLHDRFEYRRQSDDSWLLRRLQP